MPWYYSINRVTTTNGTANTCSTNLAISAAAAAASNANLVRVMAVLINARNSTAGGGELRLAYVTGANAAITLGTGITPSLKRDDFPAATASVVGDAAAIGTGGTTVEHTSIGFAETGGQNGWVALEPDDGFNLRPGRGCMRFNSYAVGTSQVISLTLHHAE